MNYYYRGLQGAVIVYDVTDEVSCSTVTMINNSSTTLCNALSLEQTSLTWDLELKTTCSATTVSRTNNTSCIIEAG